MKVLIGCERSGVVREAFRKLGHDAWSCDLEPADDGSRYHYQYNVLDVAMEQWDLGIFHPPCTYLSVSGLHWNKRRPERAALTEKAIHFAARLFVLEIDKIAIENPVGLIGTRIRPADQWIQPYQFGDDASKNTGLWLKGLKPLVGTRFVSGRLVCQACKSVYTDPDKRMTVQRYGCECGAGLDQLVSRWSNQTDSGQNKLGPSPDRAKLRSQTYPGIAAAMAEQWG